MEELGVAILELDVDEKPLIRGLADAERRTATSVAVMQGMLDQISDGYKRQAAAASAAADVEVAAADRVSAAYAREAAAARAAGAERAGTAPMSAPTPGATSGPTEVRVSEAGGVWGVRGPQHPGSLTNPIVAVIEAAKYAPMGAMAAAIGESNAAQQGAGDSPIASAIDLAALSEQVGQLSRSIDAGNRLAQAGAQG